jgi:hypothetical protein
MRKSIPAASLVVACIALVVAVGGGTAVFAASHGSSAHASKKKKVKVKRGPAGPPGAPGAPGTPGTPGAPGGTGVASVDFVKSAAVTVDASDSNTGEVLCPVGLQPTGGGVEQTGGGNGDLQIRGTYPITVGLLNGWSGTVFNTDGIGHQFTVWVACVSGTKTGNVLPGS